MILQKINVKKQLSMTAVHLLQLYPVSTLRTARKGSPDLHKIVH
ncbi:hypothetical protein V7182_22640 [Neobacillus drentensis]